LSERFSKRASIGALDAGWLAVEITTEPGNNRQWQTRRSPGRIYRNLNLKSTRLFATTGATGLFFFPRQYRQRGVPSSEALVFRIGRSARPSLANKQMDAWASGKKERDNQTWTQFVAVQD